MNDKHPILDYLVPSNRRNGGHIVFGADPIAWLKVFRIVPEFRILRLTFQRKSATKCRIRKIIIGLQNYIWSV